MSENKLKRDYINYLKDKYSDLLIANMLAETPDFFYSTGRDFQEFFKTIPNVETIKLHYIFIGFLDYMSISLYNIEHEERDYLEANKIKYYEESDNCWSFVYFKLDYSNDSIIILNELIKSKMRHFKNEQNRYKS
jgi:hypothetical protein